MHALANLHTDPHGTNLSINDIRALPFQHYHSISSEDAIRRSGGVNTLKWRGSNHLNDNDDVVYVIWSFRLFMEDGGSASEALGLNRSRKKTTTKTTTSNCIRVEPLMTKRDSAHDVTWHDTIKKHDSAQDVTWHDTIKNHDSANDVTYMTW